MKSIVMAIAAVSALGAMFLVPRASNADAHSDCTVVCAGEQSSRDNNCPPGGQYTDVARQKCLQDSKKTYSQCMSACPPKAK